MYTRLELCTNGASDDCVHVYLLLYSLYIYENKTRNSQLELGSGIRANPRNYIKRHFCDFLTNTGSKFSLYDGNMERMDQTFGQEQLNIRSQ